MTRWLPTCALAAGLSVIAAPAPAAADERRSLFEHATAALEKGEYQTAIDEFEALADRGFNHPNASFNRGLAYVARVRAQGDRPGDLGRAAAAFEEALLQQPGDAEADKALDLVRAEVTRRRSRAHKAEVDARPTLDRMIVHLASETTWAILALLASAAFTAGLALRRRRSGPAHVAGSVLAPAAFVALAAFVPLAWGSRWLAANTRPAVVVAPEAALTNDRGNRLPGPSIPEAAAVEVAERREGLVRVRWGATEGWIPSSSVRLLQR
jgi:hypothetical protein